MTDLSRQAELSKIYTNHSLRATSINLMDEAGVEARHIMRISGHRYKKKYFAWPLLKFLTFFVK